MVEILTNPSIQQKPSKQRSDELSSAWGTELEAACGPDAPTWFWLDLKVTVARHTPAYLATWEVFRNACLKPLEDRRRCSATDVFGVRSRSVFWTWLWCATQRCSNALMQFGLRCFQRQPVDPVRSGASATARGGLPLHSMLIWDMKVLKRNPS